MDHLWLTTNYRYLTDADSAFSWTGGNVQVRTPQGMQVYVLPALTGRIAQDRNNTTLHLMHREQMLIHLALQPSGWAKVEIRPALFTLAGFTLPEGMNPDAAALVLEEKIF